MEKLFSPVARILLAHIFILSGITKIGAYAGTQAYMESMGVPGALLSIVIVLEIVGGLAVLIGLQARWAALALAGFSVVSALIFHANLADQMQMIMFMKNWAIAGGLLFITAQGSGSFSVDNWLARKNSRISKTTEVKNSAYSAV